MRELRIFKLFDKLVERIVDRFTPTDREPVLAVWRENRRELILDAASMFGSQYGYVVGDDDGDRPILDFWKWLIESGKIQPFMKFLVEEFLPALFQLILGLITAL